MAAKTIESKRENFPGREILQKLSDPKRRKVGKEKKRGIPFPNRGGGESRRGMEGTGD